MKSEEYTNNNKFAYLSLIQNDSIDFNDLYKKQGKNHNNSFSDNECQAERNNKANPMIDNFNDNDKNFLFLKKKIIRKKSAKQKQEDDVYEKFQEENALNRRSMRVKINSLKTDNTKKARVTRNANKKENEDDKNPKIKSDKKNKIQKKTQNVNEKAKEESNENDLENHISNKGDKQFTFSIADMLKRNREGENVSFQVSNVNGNFEETKKSKHSKKKTKEKLLEENMKKLKNEENIRGMNLAS